MIAKMNLGGLRHHLDYIGLYFGLIERVWGHLRVLGNQKQRKLAA